MIDLYTWGTPNGHKASIMLEETGLPYTVHPINISKGEQHSPDFLAINPNGKIPAIVDHDIDRDAENGLAVFESGAILVYLAEKAGKLLPSGTDRAKVLSWVFWQVGGLGPMLGQWGHFTRSAPEKIPYAIDRYFQESLRLLDVLDQHLANHEYIVDQYSIADIANYTWSAGGLKFIKGQQPDIETRFPHLKQWIDRISQRPAVITRMQVPKLN
jgi:GST-like protein